VCHYLIDNNYLSVRTAIIARYSLTSVPCTFRAILLKVQRRSASAAPIPTHSRCSVCSQGPTESLLTSDAIPTKLLISFIRGQIGHVQQNIEKARKFCERCAFGITHTVRVAMY